MGCSSFASIAFALLLISANAGDLTPTERVIEMLTELKAEVTKEGEAEAATYNEFHTFCTDTEAAKKEAISTGEDNENNLNATLKDKAGQLDTTNNNLMKMRDEKETLEKEKKENKVQCAEDSTNYEAQDADLTAAVFGLQQAIEKLGNAEAVAKAPALLQQGASLQMGNIEHSLKLAEAMGFVEEPKHKAISAFLQGGAPWLEEPGKEHNKKDYEFQSGAIVDLLNKLLEEFQKEKSDAAATWAKREEDCNTVNAEKTDAIATKAGNIKTAEEEADQLTSDIGTAKADLLVTLKNLKDDRHYLAELQLNCENRAMDWEQRSRARKGELKAIDTAVGILAKKVKGLDDAVGRNAALLEAKAAAAPPAFVQLKAANLLARSRSISIHQLNLQKQQKDLATKKKIIEMLAAGGSRLGSRRLSMLAMRLGEPGNDLSEGNILVGVKQMIMALVTNLKDEATAEADQKGSCTTRLGKANFERDHRLSQANKLDAELKNLESKRIFLSEEINLLQDAIEKLTAELEEATKIREEEAAENKDTIAKSKEGAAAVKDALKGLKAFYHGVSKDAAKHAKKMAQKAAKEAESLVQQTPPDAGFSGSYGGKQDSTGGILGMMEIIQSDFEKTAADTLAADQKAEKEFRDLKSASNEDIAAKDVTKKLHEEDRESTVGMLTQRMNDLQRASDLLDDALEVLEALKPECVDNGESYEEMKATRDAEILMLTTALCILDPNDVEEICDTGDFE
eukprot:TRINITY_DN1235_c0_g1_i1.p1 TRINITY_DN1235_c0_g1~~TRINITY_DN1235_c0_g1_i1.p1  ORF type:complete len:740 (-),score=288.03 TRINITY_DN1235_c0_g1_i1:98-2317(-)